MAVSPNRPLLLVALTAAALATAAPAGAATPGTTIWAGVPAGFGPFPAQDVNDSGAYSSAVDRPDHLGASADGRYVVFASDSDGLSSEDDNTVTNIFVRDRTTGTTTLVSRASGAAGTPSNGSSSDPTISDDGRYVAFSSRADNLAAHDTDTDDDVFVRDRQTDTTILISETTGVFATTSDGSSVEPVISGDGSAVAFTTTATNLDGPLGPDGDTDPDVYRRTLAGAMSLVSRATGGSQGNGVSFEPAISDDGDVVAFVSASTNLDAADTDATDSVFRRSVSGTTTVLVSRQSAGDGGANADGYAEAPAISGDGDAIAFRTAATNLDGPGGPDTSTGSDVYVRRVGTATTTLVSRANGLAGAALNDASTPGISDDGSRVAFASGSALVFPPVPGFDTAPLVERVPATGATTLLSTGPGSIAGLYAYRASYVGSGSAVVFAAGGAAGLGGGQDGLFAHVFLRQPPAGPELISRPTGNAPVSGAMQRSGSGGEDGLRQLSADGRFVVFTTSSPAILGKTTAIEQSIVRRDLYTGQTILISRASGEEGAPADSFALQPSISADGNRVAFRSAADNLDPADTDGVNDTFVRDVGAATTSLVSRADGPSGAGGDGASLSARISPGGRYVAFTSSSTNLVPGDGNAQTDAFVRDLDRGSTTLVSRADGAAGALGNGYTPVADVSSDGRRVVFQTQSTNLGDGDADASTDIYVRDLAANTTRLVSRADGNGAKATATSPVISADGRVVGFESADTSLGLPPATPPQTFVRDLGAATTRIVSSTAAGAVGDGRSTPEGLNDDGSLVTFESEAANLGVPASGRAVLLRRMATPGSEIISRVDGAAGAPAGRFTNGGSISGDGTCAVFSAAGAPVPLARDLARLRAGLRPGALPRVPEGPAGDRDQRAVGQAGQGQRVVRLQRGRGRLDVRVPDLVVRRVRRLRADAAALRSSGRPVHGRGARRRPGRHRGPDARDRDGHDRGAARHQELHGHPRAVPRRPGRDGDLGGEETKKRKAATGTTFGIAVSEPGRLRIALDQRVKGRRVGRSCRKATRRLRARKSCTRIVRVGTLSRRLTTHVREGEVLRPARPQAPRRGDVHRDRDRHRRRGERVRSQVAHAHRAAMSASRVPESFDVDWVVIGSGFGGSV